VKNEGRVSYSSRRYGAGAFMRRKQWWYFEGLDETRRLYFVFLALEATPMSYVSLKVIDYKSGTRWSEDHFGRFQAAPGDKVEVSAQGKWGFLRFSGKAEAGWHVEVKTEHVAADIRQHPEADLHMNNLLTKRIDYAIRQFIKNDCTGELSMDGNSGSFSGYGYHEHNWGVQPRHSTAHWLHFWSPTAAGVVLSCHYDEGLPHHYSFLWTGGEEKTLHSPAEFLFDPADPEKPWTAVSPDLRIEARPITGFKTRIRVPAFLPYVDVDYYEQLLEVKGRAIVEGKDVPIQGMGKLDFNWNRW
jgi:hypothetical protein